MFARAGSPPLRKQQIAQALPSSSSPDAYLSFPVASRFKIPMSTYSNKAQCFSQNGTFYPPTLTRWFCFRATASFARWSKRFQLPHSRSKRRNNIGEIGPISQNLRLEDVCASKLQTAEPHQSLQHWTMQPSPVAPWIASRSDGIRCTPKRREDRQLFGKIVAGV